MPQFALRAALFLWMAVFAALPGFAQIIPGLPGLGAASQEPAEDTPESVLAAALREAAQSGVSVVVIGSDGQVITTTGQPATTPEGTAGAMDGASSLMHAQSEISHFRHTLHERLQALPNSIAEVKFILRATSPDGRIMTYVEVLFWTLLLIVGAMYFTTKTYGEHFAKNLIVARSLENPQGYHEKMPLLVFRFLMGIGGTVYAMVTSYVAGYLIFGSVDDLSVQFTVTAIYAAFFASRTVSDVWRMVLSPFLKQYRIPRFSDRDAKRLYYWARLLATYDISSVIFSTWISDFGLNYNVYAILYGLLALVGSLVTVAMILFNRTAITNAILNGRSVIEVSWITRLLSVFWAPLLMIYIVFSWFELAFDLVLEQPISLPLVAGTYSIFMSIIVVYGGINFVIERYFDRIRRVDRINSDLAAADAEEDGTYLDGELLRSDLDSHPIATYEDLARRVAGILAFVAGSYALILIWNPESNMLENSLSARVLDVVSILFIGYIVYHFFRIWIDSKIDEETVDVVGGELGDEGGDTGASRLATLLPLFRGAILAVVIVSIALIALMEIGINVSPLFAGAGVVGLAVGFGSQTLVRDIFSGAFFLLDDAFRKGEYIDIGDVKGTVEKISVRSFQLRHHLGALNTIPFGEIKVLTNYSRDWVIMKLPLRVTYDTDVEKVRKMIKNLGVELLDDPVIGGNFIQPLKSQGVIEMQDSAMIIRVKFMTKPGDQWLVRKKVYEEIRERFAREGIHFAHREVTVRLADAKVDDLNTEQKEAVAGAVQGVIDEDYLDEIGPSGDDR
ncbi:MAG: small-conductance mechanosensitive channel [Paracoccaceae bacterium]|jgi:small-conductance mechanosensitive channel